MSSVRYDTAKESLDREAVATFDAYNVAIIRAGTTHDLADSKHVSRADVFNPSTLAFEDQLGKTPVDNEVGKRFDVVHGQRPTLHDRIEALRLLNVALLRIPPSLMTTHIQNEGCLRSLKPHETVVQPDFISERK